MEVSSSEFPRQAKDALLNPTLQRSLNGVRTMMTGLRTAAIRDLPDFAALRVRATGIRDRSLAQLDTLLEQFETQIAAAGGTVHWARTGAEACRIAADLCRAAGARTVIKSKSMVTEEIGLNEVLQQAGLKVTETDLGEYIIQLRGERPSHILAPALHLSLADVGHAFETHHARTRTHPLTEAGEMLTEAREELRSVFLGADVGITGANFLVAQTGSVVIVTNEGNADLTASLPDTHIVITGIEKVVPTLEDVGVLLRLLARSAIGEPLSSYTTLVHGARRPGDQSGPRNFHVVLVDNGRSALLGTPYQEILRCIRCSACLNHCPVYTAIGGHAYGSVYSGPMGAVLTPALAGLGAAHHLPGASTFCGRCAEVCPVSIPIPRLLRRWREEGLRQRRSPWGERAGLRLWRWLAASPLRYRLALGVAARLLRSLSVPERGSARRWVRRMPLAGSGFSDFRDLRAPAGETFQQRWRRRQRLKGKTG
jgi:L-lactate dehydrogenase complex protein LldF